MGIRFNILCAVLLMCAALSTPARSAGLTDHRIDVDVRVEAGYDLPDGYVITGLGFGQRYPDDITTLRIRMQPLLEEGALGEAIVVRAGGVPEWGLAADIDLPGGWVAVGYGASPNTLAVWAAPIKPDGSLGEVKEFRAGADPEGELHVRFVCDENRVLTGLGMRRSGDFITDARARSARTPGTKAGTAPTASSDEGLKLVGRRVDVDERTESVWGAPDGWVITGLGARASGQDVDAVMLRMNYLYPGGRLGDDVYVKSGWGASRNLEAEVLLPEGWVVVGAACSGQPEGDIRNLVVYGSPILPDGKLGIVRVFKSGFDPDSRDREREVMLEGNRVLTGFGLRMSGHSITGMRAESMEIVGVPAKAAE